MTTFALVAFTYVAVFGLLISVVWSIRPDAHLRSSTSSAGVDLPALASRDPDVARALRFQSGFGTSQMLGVNLMALLILWIPFRHGETWAWCALWYYPAMFLWHYLHYARGNRMSHAQLFNGALTASALLANAGRFF